VVSDKHLSQDVDANNKVDFYFADVISAQDYWPFGSGIADRTFVASGAGDYRYGFNGMERDGDFGNQYDYGFRIYNSQVARFLSVDPLAVKFPMLTPYQYASNCPILMVDIDGLEGTPSTDRSQSDQLEYGKVVPDYQSAYSPGWPIPNRFDGGQLKITSGFRRTDGGGYHGGIDISYTGGQREGAPVVATHPGTVAFVGAVPGGGYSVWLRGENDGKVIQTVYMHLLERPELTEGQSVEAGALIGRMAGTSADLEGIVTQGAYADHLHYEIGELPSGAEAITDRQRPRLNPVISVDGNTNTERLPGEIWPQNGRQVAEGRAAIYKPMEYLGLGNTPIPPPSPSSSPRLPYWSGGNNEGAWVRALKSFLR
jgi:RHS repeat-associated protein